MTKNYSSSSIGTYTRYNYAFRHTALKTVYFFIDKKEAFDFAMTNIKNIKKNLNKRIVELNNFLIED